MLIALLTAATAQTITLPCADSLGDTARYRFDYRAAKPDGATAFQRTYSLAVGARTEDVLPIVMHTESARVIEAGSGTGAAATRALVETPLPDVVARVRFPDTGTEVTFTNLGELTGALRQPVRSAVVATLPAGGPQRTSAVDELLDMVLSETVIERSLLGYYLPVYGYTCQTWPLGEAAQQVALPNPLGGEPLPATLTVTMHPVQPDGSYRVEEAQVLGDINVAAVVGPLVEQLGLPPEAIEPMLATPIRIQNATELVVDADGWLRSASTHKTVELLGQHSTETTRLQRAPMP